MKKFLLVFALLLVAVSIYFSYQLGKKNQDVAKAGASTEQLYPYILYSQEDLYRDEGSVLAPLGVPVSLSYDIVLFDLRNSETATLTQGGLKNRFCASSDGKVYYDVGRKGGEDIWAIDLKKKTQYLFVSGEGYVSGSGASDYDHYAAAPTCSHDGKYIAFEGNPDGYRAILRVDADGRNIRMLSRQAMAHCGSPEYSPDDKWIAYDCLPVRADGKYDQFDIWVMGSDGSGQQLIFSEPGTNSHRPVWRPKGKERWLLFYSMIGSKYGIRAVLLDNDNKILRLDKLVDDGYENMNPHWSPDGKYVIYQSRRPFENSKGGIVDDYDVYTFEFNPDIPCRPIPVSKGNFKETNPIWCGFSSNEVWGSDLSGYLSDGIVVDSAMMKQKKGI
jgi:Tol biopolymer transport system component